MRIRRFLTARRLLVLSAVAALPLPAPHRAQSFHVERLRAGPAMRTGPDGAAAMMRVSGGEAQEALG
jgi:hypothetical protein